MGVYQRSARPILSGAFLPLLLLLALVGAASGAAIAKTNAVAEDRPVSRRSSSARGLIDSFLGQMGFDTNVDPYLARINDDCYQGKIAECVKYKAIETVSQFLERDEYDVGDNVKVVRVDDISSRMDEPPVIYEVDTRPDASEWERLMGFVTRKGDEFIRTHAFAVELPEWMNYQRDDFEDETDVIPGQEPEPEPDHHQDAENDYAVQEAPQARFIDEIADEIDTIENKKDTIFSRNRLKTLFIPMLIILKLFKLKLLLFLPLIFGLVSFKKLLGIMLILIPGLISFLYLYKSFTQTYTPPVYTQTGVGYPSTFNKDPLGYPIHNGYPASPYYAYNGHGGGYGPGPQNKNWSYQNLRDFPQLQHYQQYDYQGEGVVQDHQGQGQVQVAQSAAEITKKNS